MENVGQLQTAARIQPGQPATPAGVRAWTVGEIFTATVVRAGAPDAPAVLRIGREQVLARATIPLEPGQQLRLQVRESGPPAVLTPRTPADDSAQAAVQILRGALPQQRPLGEALTVLERLASQPQGRRSNDLPAPTRAMLGDLLASLPQPREAARPGGLAAMFRNSGLFLEALQQRAEQGGQAPPAAAPDFKARVEAVAQSLQRALQQTSQQDVQGHAAAGTRAGALDEAESALRTLTARIETHQVMSARSTADGAPPQWRADLPFGGDRGPWSARLSLRRDRAGGVSRDGGEPPWVAELEMQPPGASAPLSVRVSLVGDRVHTAFTSEDAATLERLSAHAASLERRLREAALTPGTLTCECAPPPDDPALAALPGLVDTRA